MAYSSSFVWKTVMPHSIHNSLSISLLLSTPQAMYIYPMKQVIVIGAGIAGLATSIRLKVAGHHVQVVEANDYPGGKLHAIQLGNYRFDAGPSLFTMPHYIDELFELCGENPRAHFNYQKKDKVCHYFWQDGTSFVVDADPSRFVQEASYFFSESKDVIETYISRNEFKYRTTYPLFIERSLHKINSYLHRDVLKGIVSIPKLNLFSTLHEVNASYFSNPKLIQLFDRFATYNGSSPFRTPGIMSMIPHLEMKLGTYFPEGGMHAITQSIYQLALRQGVEFLFGERAKKIHYSNNQVKGVQTEFRYLPADIVVSNADVYTTYKQLLSELPMPQNIIKQVRSSSGLIFYWGIKKEFAQLGLHNIFFSTDYKQEFEAIFQQKVIPSDPTVYINITSKDKADDAPSGAENWFVMVNAPANNGQDWSIQKEKTRKTILEKLSNILQTDIASLIEVEEVLDPIKIEHNTSSYQGSLYGTSSNSRNAAFARQPNFSTHIEDLYFCGGSVHPGGGIPLCLQSARIVSDLITS